MIRTALKPAWLALLALLVVVVVAFYQLGMWQLGVSSNKASREQAAAQAARPTEPLADVLAPHQAFPDRGAGLSVATEGEYVPSLQFLVPDRVLEGEQGYWVLTPLRTEVSGNPALLPVMRGFVTDPAQADVPPTTPVSIEGTLTPSESPVGGDHPEGQRGAIDTADLANEWGEPIYNAFVFLVEEDPAVTSAEVVRVPPPVFGESGIVWRNVGYGLQWFVFAAFAVYMYYRFLRDATRQQADQGDDDQGDDDPAKPHTPPHSRSDSPPPRPTLAGTAPTREGDPS